MNMEIPKTIIAAISHAHTCAHTGGFGRLAPVRLFDWARVKTSNSDTTIHSVIESMEVL